MSMYSAHTTALEILSQVYGKQCLQQIVLVKCQACTSMSVDIPIIYDHHEEIKKIKRNGQ